MKVLDRIANDYHMQFDMAYGEAYTLAIEEVQNRFKRRHKRRLWWYPSSH